MVQNKIFISANELLEDAFELGKLVLDSAYRPDLIIGIWRGGAPIAIAIHELLTLKGIDVDHIPVRATSYRGINEQQTEVEICGLDYLVEGPGQLNKRPFNKLLIVDDVLDSGNTLTALISGVNDQHSRGGTDGQPEIRIATPWYKPRQNKSRLTPDYHLHTTDAWLVFPHELCGISKAELLAHKPGIGKIKQYLD